MVRAIQPSRHWKTLVWCRALQGLVVPISTVASSLMVTTPISFETEQALRLYGVNHGSIWGSRPSAFSGCPRGHRDYTETGCHRHRVVYRPLSYSPSNPSVS